MNKIAATIDQISENDSLALIDVTCFSDQRMTALVIDEATSFQVGTPCWVLFKETEISISQHENAIGIENCLPAQIKEVEHAKVLTEVVLEYKNVDITVIITRRLFEQLGFKPNQGVFWYIKANEVMLSLRNTDES